MPDLIPVGPFDCWGALLGAPDGLGREGLAGLQIIRRDGQGQGLGWKAWSRGVASHSDERCEADL